MTDGGVMSDQIFTIPFYHYSQSVFEGIREEIQHERSETLENADEFIKSIISSHQLIQLSIDWDSIKILPNHREEEFHHNDIFGEDVRTVVPIYKFEVKYTGSQILFTIQPGTSRVMHLEADVLDDKISFEVRDSDKGRLEQIKEGIKFNVENQKSEVNSFNNELEVTARTAVERRKQELEKHGQGLNSFGVPIKDTDN